MVLSVHAEVPPLSVDGGGAVRVGATSVTLDAIVYAHESGRTPEQIVSDYPTVSLAEVYSAIAYYLRHREQVEAYLRRRQDDAEQLRREMERKFPPRGPSRTELLARWEKRFGAPFPRREGPSEADS